MHQNRHISWLQDQINVCAPPPPGAYQKQSFHFHFMKIRFHLSFTKKLILPLFSEHFLNQEVKKTHLSHMKVN